MNYNSDFDLDLERGQIYEEKLKDIFSKPIEVKTDFLCEKTGNVAIELWYKDKPSGLLTSKAEYFAICLPKDDTYIMVKRTKLLNMLNNPKYKRVYGGDNNHSVMMLIKVEDLVK